MRAGRLRRAALPARRARRADGAGRRGREGGRRHPLDHLHRRRRGRPRTRSPRPGRPPAAFTIARASTRRASRTPCAAGATRVRADQLTKVVLARDIVVTAERPSTCTPSSSGCGRRSARATATRSTASSAPAPSCSWPATATSCAPTPWPAPRRAPATRPPTPGSPPSSSPRRRTRSSTASSSRSCATRLLPWCSYVDWEAEPSIVTVANVQHLGTLVEGRLSPTAPNVLELVGALQPTPALGGHPRAEALALIAELEDFDRGRYGGPVGWVDADGDGQWAVGIRCAEIDGPRGPAVRRGRRGGRERPRRRAGRDAGQVPGHALGDHPSMTPTPRREHHGEGRDLLRRRVPVVLHRQAPLRARPGRVRGRRRRPVVWKPYQLDPRAPKEPTPALDAYARKFGARSPADHRPDDRDRRRPRASTCTSTSPSGPTRSTPTGCCGYAGARGQPGRHEGAAAAGLLHRGRRRRRPRPARSAWPPRSACLPSGSRRSSPPTTARPRCARS